MIQGINNVAFNGGKDTLVKKAGITVKELAHDSYAATRRNIDSALLKAQNDAKDAEYIARVTGMSKPSSEERLFNIGNFAERAKAYGDSHGAVGYKLDLNA
ncbi:MAG: hypothetical protein ACLSWI_08500 [Candidatus Gastranaerophilaceae bacterium]